MSAEALDPKAGAARRGMCAAVLTLEAISLGLITPVLINLSDVGTGPALVIGLGLAATCILLAGRLKTSWGYWGGHLVQVAAIALGFVEPSMFFLGAVFAMLWATAYWLGVKIERERNEAYAAFAARDDDA